MPRTGSVWWALYQQRKHPGSIVLHETFNYMVYRTEIEGSKVFSETYKEGYWWISPREDNLGVERKFCQRDLTNTELFDRWEKFIEAQTVPVVCRNHVIPTDEKYLKFLADNGSEVYYTYRENIAEQLASHTIGKHTMEFAVFSLERSNQSRKFSQSIINENILVDFAGRIRRGEELIRKFAPNCTWVKYEDMPFSEVTLGMPRKQNLSAFDRLCEEDQERILKLVESIK